MLFRKQKAVIAAILTAAMAVSVTIPSFAAATQQVIQPKGEQHNGEDTYSQRALSLYYDIVTNGIENGYLSSQTGTGSAKGTGAGKGFGIPYHSVETMIIEAPDYGHENTSEAMSYIAWVAAMHDALIKVNPDDSNGDTTDFAKAWTTMETMIPNVQTNFFGDVSPTTPALAIEATYADEYQDPSDYPGNNSGAKATNPLYGHFVDAYESDGGYYLLHWLADVDDWYGYGAESGNGAGKFTFVNSFQRGEQESCWETVPHPAIETLTYGAKGLGIIAVFSGESTPSAQWRYTNAPDAEDRTIQAAYFANIMGVGDSKISKAAGKMSDQMRNNMFDKYYQEIGYNVDGSAGSGKQAIANSTDKTPTSVSDKYASCHYLMAWYTSWGGSNDDTAIEQYGGWRWQIGASHMHEFYQNPLAAYAKLYDTGINAGMEAKDATKDWETSLDRQLDFYEWLQASDGPFAGGATNSFNGRYEGWDNSAACLNGVTAKTTFNDMFYLPHPVYMDPGSNHWIGNQVWATQRLTELYYHTGKTEMGEVTPGGDKSGSINVHERLGAMLDKWVAWAVDGETIRLGVEPYGYEMAENLDWFGQPDTWTGTPTDNADLTHTIRDYAAGDIGVVASMANTLIWYAAANGVDGKYAHEEGTTVPQKALYYASTLLDCMWANLRDDIGIAAPGSFDANFTHRFFTQEVYVPVSYGSATLPNGGKLANGITFYDLRPKYEDEPSFAYLQDNVDRFPELAEPGNITADRMTEINAEINEAGVNDIDVIYHRFWHEGDQVMALGSMALLYPDVTPQGTTPKTPDTVGPVVTPASITLEVDQSKSLASLITAVDYDDDGAETGKTISYSVEDTDIAEYNSSNGRLSAWKKGTTNLLVSDGKNVTKVLITVVEEGGGIVTTTKEPEKDPTKVLYGDVDVDGQACKITDVILLSKHVSKKLQLPAGSDYLANADVNQKVAGAVDTNDLKTVIDVLLGTESLSALPIK
jgi:hypothetical protein